MRKLTAGLQLRIYAAIYYGFVFALAIYRCVVMFSGRLEQKEVSHLTLVLFAGLTVAGWWFMGNLRRSSDRIAAFFYGAFYAVRIGTSFARGTMASLLAAVATVLISAGMMAVLVGVLHAMSREPQSRNGITV